jgi:SP family galactose:H+ symporter-like MFS transporter
MFRVMAIGLGVAGAMMHFGIATHGEQVLSIAMLLLFIVGFAMSAGPLMVGAKRRDGNLR